MKKRELRHNAIREIIRTHEVRTQRDLADLLLKVGFECTQATVSRDIVDLGLVKTAHGGYALPEELRLQRLVGEVVRDVRAAGNLVVIHTFGGEASALCVAIDAASWEGVLGSIAGDDTIFLAVDSVEHAKIIEETIDRLRR